MTNKDKHIPQGYKSSPLGIIPEDWEVKRLGDYVTITSGESPSLYVLKTTGRFPYVKVEDMNNCSKYQTQSREYSDIEKSVVPKGSIIFPKRGAAILNNKVRIAQTDLLMDSNMMAITPKDGQLDSEYLYYTIIKEQLYKIADTSTIPQINNKHIIPYRFCLPSLVEQKEIVSLLITWDTAIEKQTVLIEKLTLRKRGLMQQLLTGKKRLKGFEGGTFHRLGNYITECDRRNNGCKRVLSVTNTRGFILQEEQFDKIVASNDTSNYKVVRRGEFAYNPSRVNVGSLAMLNEYDEGILSPMYIVFKANENIDKSYLLQCLQSWWFRGHIPAYTQGSVRDSLSFDGLCSMKFYIPSLEEQKAISAILIQADREIEIAKEKLSNLQSQKRGLMQQLLTGKKRIL